MKELIKILPIFLLVEGFFVISGVWVISTATSTGIIGGLIVGYFLLFLSGLIPIVLLISFVVILIKYKVGT